MAKLCPFCAEEIQDAAIVCKHCHRDLVPKAELPLAARNESQPIANEKRNASSGRRGNGAKVGGGLLVLSGLVAASYGLHSINTAGGWMALVGWGLIFLGSACLIPGRAVWQFSGALLISIAALVGIRLAIKQLGAVPPPSAPARQAAAESGIRIDPSMQGLRAYVSSIEGKRMTLYAAGNATMKYLVVSGNKINNCDSTDSDAECLGGVNALYRTMVEEGPRNGVSCMTSQINNLLKQGDAFSNSICVSAAPLKGSAIDAGVVFAILAAGLNGKMDRSNVFVLDRRDSLNLNKANGGNNAPLLFEDINKSESAHGDLQSEGVESQEIGQCALLKQAFEEADAKVRQGCLICMQDRAHAQVAQLANGCPQSQPSESPATSQQANQGPQQEATDAAASAPVGVDYGAGSGEATDAASDAADPANIPQTRNASDASDAAGASADRQIVLSGKYDYSTDESSMDIIGDTVCFDPDSSGKKLLSGKISTDSPSYFCFSNAKTAFRLFGINPQQKIGGCGYQGSATIVISGYVPAMGEGEDSDMATLLRVVSKSETSAIKGCDG